MKTISLSTICGTLLIGGLWGCSGSQGNAEIDRREGGAESARFEFGLIGDVPYDARHEREFANVMKELDAADLAFVVHNGDFWWDGAQWTEKAGGFPPCSDETFQNRLALAQTSRHPFIFVPGDNEWADCHRAKPRPYDPFERLAKLRQMFFQGDQSLGRRTMRLTRQNEDARYARFRENVRWTFADVLFVTLHVIGSNNNFGRTPEMDAEHTQRMARTWSTIDPRKLRVPGLAFWPFAGAAIAACEHGTYANPGTGYASGSAR